MTQCQEAVQPVQFPNLGYFFDEPVSTFVDKEPVQCSYPVFESGYSELEELLSQFQAGSSSGSDVNRAMIYSLDERKKRRMVSNRESARRSRWKKKQHLENLTTEMNQLKVQNREFKNRFRSTMYLNQLVRRENDRLKAESLVLWVKLCNLYQILQTRQLLMINQ